jgi:hypothetical protein
MNRYECDRCSKLFSRKESLSYHITKNVCTGIYHDNATDGEFQCKFCGKGFTTSTSMYRHVNHTCKIKKTEDKNRDLIYIRLLELEKQNKQFEEKSKKIDVLEEENKLLKKEVLSLKKNSTKVSKITNNNVKNVNNGIVANINLIGYGKEDLSKIDKKDILKAIQYGYDSTIKLTETLHFNPKHPEYHNVYITNVKDKYAMMFDGKNWNLTMKDDLINKIYDDKKNYIEENLDEFIDSLTISRKKALERWLSTDDADDRIAKIKNEIKLLLYNKRNLILDDHDDTSCPKKTKPTKKSLVAYLL